MKDDLISRRKAIDATWFDPSYTDPLNVLTEVRDRLEVLPSAQPEITVDQVIEFCEKNGLVVHSLSYFRWLLSRYEQGRKDGYAQGYRECAYISHDREVNYGI